MGEMMARGRRRLEGGEPNEVTERVARCAWLNADEVTQLCVSYNGHIEDAVVSYASYPLRTDTDTDTEEWTLVGVEVVDGQMLYECNDNFADFETVCIEKWRTDAQHVTLTAKARHGQTEPVELSLDQPLSWSERFLINEREMRLCSKLTMVGAAGVAIDADVCVHFTIVADDEDVEQVRIRHITRIAISKPRSASV